MEHDKQQLRDDLPPSWPHPLSTPGGDTALAYPSLQSRDVAQRDVAGL